MLLRSPLKGLQPIALSPDQNLVIGETIARVEAIFRGQSFPHLVLRVIDNTCLGVSGKDWSSLSPEQRMLLEKIRTLWYHIVRESSHLL
jgi:hypothetical protein